VPVEAITLSTISIPCENGSTNGEQGLLHDVHTPYDYNEVFK
jgi:hypothetical protein